MLNAGAGQGSFSIMLEQKGYDVVSADASSAACDVLRRRVGGRVVLADVRALPFDDASFDAVVLGEVIEHVPDDVAALTEARRVLRPSGVLALSVPAQPAWFGPSDEWAGHVRRYTRSSLMSRCAAAQLEIVRCVGWGFPVSAAFHRWIFDKRAAHVAETGTAPSRAIRVGLGILKLALSVDRLFVGVDRGALGFLLLARRVG